MMKRKLPELKLTAESGNEITRKVLEKEKQRLQEELRQKKEMMNKRHPIFTGLTNQEVANFLGEDAFKVENPVAPEPTEMTPEQRRALAKTAFRVDLDEN
jgi:hypothetical protein